MKTKKLFMTITGLSVICLWSYSFASESCTTYYDGCNTCKVVDWKIAGCTKMACKATQKPQCIDGMDQEIVWKDTTIVSEKIDRVPPYQGNKTYKFDEKAVKAINLNESSLLKINCDSSQILKSLWFGWNSKMFSVGLEEGTFDYTFDMRNCSMRGSKRNYVWTAKAISEKDAIAKAKEFMKNSFFNGKIYGKYWDPIVTYKNSNGGAIPYKIDAVSSKENSDIEIDRNDTGVVELEFTSFSIVFPYSINNKPVYNAYGNKAGITLEVTADWVSSVNAQLLLFKWAVRSSEKITSEDMVSFIKRGWNNPFRGNQQEIELQKPEKVNVLFNIFRNNINELYLSSGIKLWSKVKIDQRNPQTYEMIISDYKIGNTSYWY